MEKTSEVILNGGDAHISSLVQAMRGWETGLAEQAEKPKGQFGRVVKIEVAGLCITNDMDVEFTVPFDDDTECNEAEIIIYNLSKATIGRLKTDEELTITAGYGSDTGVIFAGVISSVKSRWRDQDKVTTIKAIDDIKLKERDVDSISFKAGVKASYILKTLVGKLNLPIAVFKTRRDHTYTEAVTVSGGLMSSIKQYAEVCGVSAYINKRKVYVQHLSEGENLNFTVDADTGLIGSPEEFTEEISNEDYTETVSGLKFSMLLEHRITTASIIALESRDFKGSYRVREGRHVGNETDFITEVTAIGAGAGIGSGSGSGSGSVSSGTPPKAKTVPKKKVSVSFTGVSAYFGSATISYVTGGKSARMVTQSSTTVKADEGSSVEITITARSGCAFTVQPGAYLTVVSNVSQGTIKTSVARGIVRDDIKLTVNWRQKT